MNEKFTKRKTEIVEFYNNDEREEVRKEIKETRDILGQFSVRDFMEGIYGDEAIGEWFPRGWGEDLLMGDLSENNISQHKKLLHEAHPEKSSTEIDDMINDYRKAETSKDIKKSKFKEERQEIKEQRKEIENQKLYTKEDVEKAIKTALFVLEDKRVDKE